MRTIKTLLAAGVIAALPVAAHAQWYVGADAGANFMQDPGVGTADSDLGWVGVANAGYSFGAPKVEFEVGYRDNDKISSLSTMVNGLYEFLPSGAWHPFVGAGIGWAWLDGDFTGSGARNSDNVFAYQGILGLSYDVSSNVALNTQYRYFSTLDANLGPKNGGDSEYHNHSIMVGVTYKFASAAPAPAPVPVAAPAPAPMPAPVVKAAPALQKNYMVFFDFNKSDISPEADRVIGQAASAAKAGNASRIELTGHSDRAGSDKYNQALSLKRGNAVKDSLVKLGLSADQIVVIGKGESQPLIQTKDGVREPQNRRVEIVLP